MGLEPVPSLSPLHRLKRRLRPRTRLKQMMKPVWYNLALLRYCMPQEVSRIYEIYARHPESYIDGYGQLIASRLDAGVIYNLVRQHRPGHVLELGCGLGTVTAVVAMAMKANGCGRVTSLEHLEWMVKLAQKILPDPCRGRVQIMLCDRELRRYFDQDWTCYRFTPEAADIDLVIVDGPPTEWEDEVGNLVYIPNGDLVGFLPYLRLGCRVFVDGRRSTVAAYRRHLGHLFRIKESLWGNYTKMEFRALVSVPVS